MKTEIDKPSLRHIIYGFTEINLYGNNLSYVRYIIMLHGL